MKKLTFLFTILSIQVALLGCSNQAAQDESETLQAPVQHLTLVTSGKPASVLPAFTTYTWSPQYNRILFGTRQGSEKELQTYIRTELTHFLSKKGYRYQRDSEQAEVVIGFLFALGNDIANQSLQNKFGLLPGVIRTRANEPRYKKGSFVLAIIDNKKNKTYWRAGVEGFMNFEDEAEDKETSRLPRILTMMLSGFPEAGS